LLSYGHGLLWQSPDLDTLLNTENILISNEIYSAFRQAEKAILATDQGIQIISRKGNDLKSRTLNKSDGLGDVIIPNIIEYKDYYFASDYDAQIYRIDTSTWSVQTFSLPTRSKINGLEMIKDEKLIVFRDDGIYALQNDIWIKTFPKEGSLEVLDIAIDEENNLWACGPENQISKANLNFESIPTMIEKSHAILKIDSQFWIGSSEGLMIVDGAKQRKILDNNITCLKMFNEDILVGTFSSGIIILNKSGQKIGSIDGWSANPNQSVLYIYAKENHIYISSLTGVTKMKLSKQADRYATSRHENLNDQIGPGYVYQILEHDGVFYFATDRQGIKILRKDSVQHVQHFENGNLLGSIYSMTKCDPGQIWFSSSLGYIGYEENGNIYAVKNERYLQDPYTSLITSVDQKVVMVRNASIDILDPKTGHYLYFNDITQSNHRELYLNCFTQDSNYIYLAQSNGVLKIANFKDQKFHPECLINKVNVNLIDITGNHNFAEHENNLEFNYSAAWMIDPDKITYQYKLDGIEDTWRNTRDQRATYPMLRPGKYKFRVKASVDGRFIQDEETTYPFTINRAFYKTWWFLIIMALFIGGMLNYWRNEQIMIKKNKDDLNKKRTEAQLLSLQTQLNPHFLFNSFNTLIGLIEENPTKGIQFTEKLTDFYRSILDVGKNDLIPLNKEIYLLNTYIHLLKERFGEQLIIDVHLDDNDAFTIPPLTLQLLIENAVKHNTVSSKNPLLITVNQEGEYLTIKNKKAPKMGILRGTGIGLENIKKRHTLKNLRPPKIDQNDEYFMVTVYLNAIE
jgi:hypothetical protein